MKRILQLALLIIVVSVLLAGCKNKNSDFKWYPTKEKAIQNGLEEEHADKSAILSIEEVNGETLVFYQMQDALGIASIVESEEGYSWYRKSPYFGFEGTNVPYMLQGTNIKTAKGQEIPILIGKVYDTSIKKINLTGDGSDRELKIFEDCQLFYSIHEAPFNELKVSFERD